jgi:hypothetical protein
VHGEKEKAWTGFDVVIRVTFLFTATFFHFGVAIVVVVLLLLLLLLLGSFPIFRALAPGYSESIRRSRRVCERFLPPPAYSCTLAAAASASAWRCDVVRWEQSKQQQRLQQ